VRTTSNDAIVTDLAPTGAPRASINLGNPVLAQGTPEAPRGGTVDLAREMAARLGVPTVVVCFDAAGPACGSAYDLFLTCTLRHAVVVRGDEGTERLVAEALRRSEP
jgi:hypothetical protein